MKKTYLLYDKDRIEISVPDSWEILEPTDPPALDDVGISISNALESPIASDSLKVLAERADKSGKAVIVISDITRPVPNSVFLPAIIEAIRSGGFREEDIVILVATGMHRSSSKQEHIELVGRNVYERYSVIDHRAEESGSLVELPDKTSSGTSVRVDRVYYEASLRVVTGFIEPHFMAGFSGGRKAICPGLVDLATIEKFHGAEFLDDDNTRMGRLDGNVCHKEALEIARMVKPDFLFNVTINGEGEITGIFAGDFEQAHLAGVEFVRKTMTVEVDERFDVIFISNGGYPLDRVFYQANKGMIAANEYLRDNGLVILVAGCRDGIGSDSFRQILFEYDDYKDFLRDIFGGAKTRLDQWGFQMQTKLLKRVGKENVIFVTDGIAESDLRRCHITPACDLVGRSAVREQVYKLVDMVCGMKDKRVAVIPRGPYILPKVCSE